MKHSEAETQVEGTARAPTTFLFLAILAVEGMLLGQHGIPIEDGGELLTVSTLGGSCHSPGMPVMALLGRCAVAACGETGLRILFAVAAAVSLWLLFRRGGLSGLLLAVSILALPGYRVRLLQWDAYGILFLAGSIAIECSRPSSIGLGYLTGLASGIHIQGLMLPLGAASWGRSPMRFIIALLLGGSVYLALPILSAAGSAVDWGAPGSLEPFLRQITASGYREVYGAFMGLSGLSFLTINLNALSEVIWPALILPAAIGAVGLSRSDRPRLLRLGILLVLDSLFAVLVNPMAAGTSQTGWLSLLVFAALAAAAMEALPLKVSVFLTAAVALSALPSIRNPILRDQNGEVRLLLRQAPYEAGIFLSDNDLLYGGWVMKYCRDSRPDIAILSTGNFTSWFEELATRYDGDLNLSGSINEVGGPAVGRDSAVRALIRMTVEDNPYRSFFIVQSRDTSGSSDDLARILLR
jgi:hypothetical protein